MGLLRNGRLSNTEHQHEKLQSQRTGGQENGAGPAKPPCPSAPEVPGPVGVPAALSCSCHPGLGAAAGGAPVLTGESRCSAAPAPALILFSVPGT